MTDKYSTIENTRAFSILLWINLQDVFLMKKASWNRTYLVLILMGAKKEGVGDEGIIDIRYRIAPENRF